MSRFTHQQEDRISTIGVGGPPRDGGLEPRVAKLESDVAHLRSDVAEIRIDSRAIREDQVRSHREVQSEFTALRREMKQDFRVQFGSLIVSTLGLAGLLAKGFEWI